MTRRGEYRSSGINAPWLQPYGIPWRLLTARFFANHRWTRHFIYRREQVKTTWTFRALVLTVIIVGVWLTSGRWTVAVARSLVCESNAAPSDAILIENLDPDYLPFEEAARLRRAGLASRVIVPIRFDADTHQPNMVSLGTANLMAGIAHLGSFEIVPRQEVEPISLNVARDVLRFAQRENIRSVLVVPPYFRSRRTSLIYAATLGRAGIIVRCSPVEGSEGDALWIRSGHGVQNVAEQWLKLQYYRLYVLPFKARS